MPQFRYEAVDPAGVPIHGVMDATDHDALVLRMSERGLRLVSTAEVSLESLVGSNRSRLPRLFQLRLGEQLRESLLTGLPAHAAVRAIASEPISHAIPGIMPWIMGAAWCIFLIAFACGQLTGEFGRGVQAAGLLAAVVIPAIWAIVHWFYNTRPRKILQKLAARLEAGEELPTQLTTMMPREVTSVMKSDIGTEKKARVAAELIPGLLNGNLRVQQFVMTLVGPLLLAAVVLIGGYSILLFVIPRFKMIFEDFGAELPKITMILLSISDLAVIFGVTGWLTASFILLISLIFIAMTLATNRGAEALERIPIFGLAFRWAMQARVARVISAMVRNGCSYAESLRVATHGSGFLSVRWNGENLAKRLESGEELPTAIPQLSGLPISMLYVSESGDRGDERRAAVAETYSSLSDMLDAATLGQGRLFAMIIQTATILFLSAATGFCVIAMFMPLIRLLGDLA